MALTSKRFASSLKRNSQEINFCTRDGTKETMFKKPIDRLMHTRRTLETVDFRNMKSFKIERTTHVSEGRKLFLKPLPSST